MLLALTTPALAQTVTSPGPSTVAVSVYRAPDRGANEVMRLDYLRGYALITETRTVTIPAGDGAIRFEGVAGGILPESAIVTGLPEGVIEKNQDANLLSPASLLGANTARHVSIRRTNRRTGKVTQEDAVIRSGPQGAVVLQTSTGVEALRCSGIPETIVYDSMPEGLSAKPTLSVRTHSDHAATMTIGLSYLADNFDWQANYVATMADDGKHLDLFGWVTLASADETSFVEARAAAIAGKVNREGGAARPETMEPSIGLHCWPSGTTSDIPLPVPVIAARGTVIGIAAPAPVMMDIVVTAQRREKSMNAVAITAIQENLGDLKLYRIPMPVTVAAHAQKQVGLMNKLRVPVTVIYRSEVGSYGDAATPMILLRAQNRTADGLGLPIPAGKVAVYQPSGDRNLLVGQGSVDDKAVGEEVEITVAAPTQVTAKLTELSRTSNTTTRQLMVSNANPRPVRYEARFPGDGYGPVLSAFSGKMTRKNGRAIWAVTLPANATATLRWTAGNG